MSCNWVTFTCCVCVSSAARSSQLESSAQVALCRSRVCLSHVCFFFFVGHWWHLCPCLDKSKCKQDHTTCFVKGRFTNTSIILELIETSSLECKHVCVILKTRWASTLKNSCLLNGFHFARAIRCGLWVGRLKVNPLQTFGVSCFEQLVVFIKFHLARTTRCTPWAGRPAKLAVFNLSRL